MLACLADRKHGLAMLCLEFSIAFVWNLVRTRFWLLTMQEPEQQSCAIHAKTCLSSKSGRILDSQVSHNTTVASSLQTCFSVMSAFRNNWKKCQYSFKRQLNHSLAGWLQCSLLKKMFQKFSKQTKSHESLKAVVFTLQSETRNTRKTRKPVKSKGDNKRNTLCKAFIGELVIGAIKTLVGGIVVTFFDLFAGFFLTQIFSAIEARYPQAGQKFLATSYTSYTGIWSIE